MSPFTKVLPKILSFEQSDTQNSKPDATMFLIIMGAEKSWEKSRTQSNDFQT
jgi:hypothetical protein